MAVSDAAADLILESRLVESLTWFPVIPIITINLDILNRAARLSKRRL